VEHINTLLDILQDSQVEHVNTICGHPAGESQGTRAHFMDILQESRMKYKNTVCGILQKIHVKNTNTLCGHPAGEEY